MAITALRSSTMLANRHRLVYSLQAALIATVQATLIHM